MNQQKIKPFLWYDNGAEEAVNFYCSLFKDSKVGKVTRYPEGGPAPAGMVMTVEFELGGVQFVALNGGPHFKLTEAFSLSVDCDDQAEVDRLWNELTEEGTPSQCGWLDDRYGVSWQIVPRDMLKLLSATDKAASQRAFDVMLTMVKIDIAAVQAAFEGR